MYENVYDDIFSKFYLIDFLILIYESFTQDLTLMTKTLIKYINRCGRSFSLKRVAGNTTAEFAITLEFKPWQQSGLSQS